MHPAHPSIPQGTIVRERFTSAVLHGNPLGDPTEREVIVYLPPSYAATPKRRFPVLFVLTGFLGTGAKLLNWEAFQPTVPDYLDAAAAGDPARGEFIAVFPDCFTSFGGSQYINSVAVGDYEAYVLELVAYVDATYRTRGAAARGITGHSSGGYGALVHAMRHPDVWNAVACRSGDMAFELCFMHDFPEVCNILGRAGGLARWWAEVTTRERRISNDFPAHNIIAMAACYSPNLANQPLPIDLPFDIETSETIPAIWERWLAHDPLHLIAQPATQDALRSLKMLHFECGRRDEFLLHFGARRLDRQLAALGIAHTYTETDDGHSGTNYRYPAILAQFAEVWGA